MKSEAVGAILTLQELLDVLSDVLGQLLEEDLRFFLGQRAHFCFILDNSMRQPYNVVSTVYYYETSELSHDVRPAKPDKFCLLGHSAALAIILAFGRFDAFS